jgi:hypothetical protein
MNRVLWIVVAVSLSGRVAARAETPAPAPTLQTLSQETQALFETVRPGIMRVHLPPTYWPGQAAAAQGENPMEKWQTKLAPELRDKINQAVGSEIAPATQPTDALPATQPGAYFLVPLPRLAVSARPDGGVELVPFSSAAAPNYDAQLPSVGLKVIALQLDDGGHVLVPLYIEPTAIQGTPLKVTTGLGKMTTATFVGSDRQTNITILKLENPIGKPVRLTGGRPDDGSLVMVLAPAGDSGRLSVWTGGQQERGIVVTMDGAVAGFARYGQFLGGAFARPVVDQLIEHGCVRRATLGVLVEETETPDGRRGMRVERVSPDSPAEKVGLVRDDYILSMGGTPVNDLPSFAAAIASRDGETELQVLRGERVFAVTVVLHPK